MARIIYALSGEGRGHTTRVLAVTHVLRRRGHEVLFCCGGTAEVILRSQGETVISIPALTHSVSENRLQVFSTLAQNFPLILRHPSIINDLAKRFEEWKPDLLLNDFEALSWRAAIRIELPVVSLNHQEIVSESHYSLGLGERIDAFVAKWGIDRIPPQNPVHRIVSSFYFPPLKAPDRTTLVGPIIRPAVQALTPTIEDHILVYFNRSRGLEPFLEALARIPAPFRIYGFSAYSSSGSYDNLEFKRPSITGFIEDLASARGVICTAGYSLISETLYLKKPLLVVPNQGQFEQWLNARFVTEQNLGTAVLGRLPTYEDVTTFLASINGDGNPAHLPPLGNEAAVERIESILQHITTSTDVYSEVGTN